MCPLLFLPSNLEKIDWPLRVLGPTAALCEMRPLCQEQAMCERKTKKDAPAAVVSRAACVSRAPPADASRLALSGWGRPAWSLRVILLLTMIDYHRRFVLDFHSFFRHQKKTGWKSCSYLLEIHTGKIHMYFVTSVLYEITCITSNTNKPDSDSNVGLCVLI